MEVFSNHKLQYLVLVCISLLVLGCVGILYFSDDQPFQRFLGSYNPLLVFLFVVILGFVLMTFFLSQQWFVIYEKENLKAALPLAGLAGLLGIIMILADTKIIFPADTNILFPDSLLFYPAIGFLVEIIFHLLPLAVLLFVLNSFLKNVTFEHLVWVCIVIISIVEPIYQAAHMASTNRHPPWAIIFVGVHIFIINFAQLSIFRKYDFTSMYFFRLIYYLFWHIGWGYLRLRLLF